MRTITFSVEKQITLCQQQVHGNSCNSGIFNEKIQIAKILLVSTFHVYLYKKETTIFCFPFS